MRTVDSGCVSGPCLPPCLVSASSLLGRFGFQLEQQQEDGKRCIQHGLGQKVDACVSSILGLDFGCIKKRGTCRYQSMLQAQAWPDREFMGVGYKKGLFRATVCHCVSSCPTMSCRSHAVCRPWCLSSYVVFGSGAGARSIPSFLFGGKFMVTRLQACGTL